MSYTLKVRAYYYDVKSQCEQEEDVVVYEDSYLK